MRAISADLILSNVLTGSKSLGAAFTPDVAGGALSDPVLTSDPNGYQTCTLAQNVPLLVAGETRNINLYVSRKLCPIAIWLVKTGAQGGAADTVVVNLGAGAQPITEPLLLNGALNGATVKARQIAPQYMEIDPTVANGYVRLAITATAGVTDTRCIVYLKCLCSGPV